MLTSIRLLSPAPVALAFAAGIAWHGPSPGGAAPALVAAGLALASWRGPARLAARWRPLAALALALAAGALVAALRSPAPVTDPASLAEPARAGVEPASAQRWRGVVTRPAAPRGDGEFSLRVRSGALVVQVRARTPAQPGDELVLTGRLRPLGGGRNFGAPDRAAAARADELDADLFAESLQIVGRRAGLSFALWRAVGSVSARWQVRLAPGAPGAQRCERALLAGVTLGVRGELCDALEQRWRALGIYHALSVSGLHLAVVAMAVFAGLRRLAAAAGAARPATVALPPALALAVGYTLLTGAEVATLRALVACALGMVAAALGRPLRLLDAVGVAGLALLAWAPAQLFEPGFQLSFAATLALALAPPAPPSPPPHGAAPVRAVRLGARWLARGLAVSARVALVTAPITAYHFHQVQPAGVVGNLVITPLVELVALPLGLAGLPLGELWPGGGDALLSAAVFALRVADGLAAALAPWCPVGEVAIGAAWLGVALWLASGALAATTGRPRRAGLAALAVAVLWRAAPLSPPAGVRVVFFDVGQGDAALIETASELWLVDAGGAPGASSRERAAAPGRAIARYLRGLRRARLDVVVVSHPHPDHYLGLLALLEPAPGSAAVEIGELWLPEGFVRGSPGAAPAAAGAPAVEAALAAAPAGGGGRSAGWAPSFAEVVLALERAGTKVRAPPVLGRHSREGARLAMLAPRYRPRLDAAPALAADPVRSVNDNSAVVLLEYGGRRALLTGDLEREGEDALLDEWAAGALRVDVVKVPHHGSRTSSSAPFVRATSPAVAVISCGVANRFGFPAPEVVERWLGAGARVLRTDVGGAVRLEISPRGELAVERP